MKAIVSRLVSRFCRYPPQQYQPNVEKYDRYDRHIAELRRGKIELRQMRQALARPTGNFVEDMSTGAGGDAGD